MWHKLCNVVFRILIQRVNDPDIQSSVIEVEGENVATNYITCPMNASDSLGNNLSRLWFLAEASFLSWDIFSDNFVIFHQNLSRIHHINSVLFRYKAAIYSFRCEKYEKIFYIWNTNKGW